MAHLEGDGALKRRNRRPLEEGRRSEKPWSGSFPIIAKHLGDQVFSMLAQPVREVTYG